MRILQTIKKRFLSTVESSLKRIEKRLANTNSDQVPQLLLKNHYKTLSREEVRKYKFDEVGFRKYSQNSEDGILLFIFSVIGTTNKRCLEICAGDGIECNT